MIYTYRIARVDMAILLEKFANKVNNKEYERLNYQIWKKLKNAYCLTLGLVVGGQDQVKAYLFNSDSADITAYADEVIDLPISSFGGYILDLNKEGERGLLATMSSQFYESLNTTSGHVNTSLTTNTISGTLTTNATDYTILSGTICADKVYYDESLDSRISNLEKTMKENETMNTGIKFNFGTCEKDNIRLSMYGIAIKNAANEWVAYDSKTGNIMNVDIFNFDGGKYLFKMPVAIKDIKVGDTVVHNGIPMYVKGLSEGSHYPIVVDPKAGEEKTILPTKNMFGFDFATKVVSLFDMGSAAAPSKDSPFGNMWPLLLADGNTDPLLLMMMSNGMKDMNSMMMYALMSKDKGNSDMGLLMAMSMMGQKQLKPKIEKYGKQIMRNKEPS